MRKGLKKIFITAASCLALVCVSAGGATLVWANGTVDPVSLMENSGAFYTVPGASVKLYEGTTADGVDGNAMRFTFEMSEAQYAKMIENGAYKNGASVSAYVIAEEKIDADKTTAAQIATDTDAIAAVIPASKWQSATSIVKGSSAKVYYACAYVYDLPNTNVYDKNVSAFAIATQTDSTKLYSSVQSRSMAYVADEALDTMKYEEYRTTLESYLPTYDVSFYAEDGVTVLGTTQARYGSAAVETDAVNEVLIGENVAEFPRYTATWHEKTGDAWAEDGNALSAYEVTGNTAYKMTLTDNGIMQAKLAATVADHATVNGYNLGGIITDVADNVIYSNGGNTVTAASDGNWFYPLSNTIGTEYSYKATVHADATYYQARDGVTTYMPGVSIATSNADGSSAFAVTAKFAYWEKAGSVVLSISTLGYRTNVVLYGSFADVYESRNADYSNWGDGALNATVEFVKTVDSILLYIDGQKLCTMTADGVTLAAGVTSNNDATLTSDDYKNRLACFFGEGVESVCGIQGESMKTSLDFTYTVEQKEIDSDTIHLTNLEHATVNGYNLGDIVTDVADGITYTNGDGGNTVTARSDGDWFYSFNNTVGTEYFYKVTLHEDDVHYNKLGESTKVYMPGAAIATSNADGSSAFSVAVKFAYWESAGNVILSVATLGWRRDISLQASFADVYEKRISADETNGTKGWGDGEFNATVEFVKTTSDLTIYVGGQKLCNMTADGIVVADGVTCTDTKLTDDTTKTRLACFFGEGVQSVGGIQGEAMDANLDFSYDVEYAELNDQIVANLAHATVNGYNIGDIVTDEVNDIAYSNLGNTVTGKSDGDWFYSFNNTVGTEYTYEATIHADDTYYNKLGESTKVYMPGVAIATSNADGSNAFSISAKFAYWGSAGNVILSVATLGWRRDISLQGSFADVYATRIASDATDGTAGWGDGELNATVKFVKTENDITLYVEGQKMCTIMADGIVVAEGVTCTDTKLTDDTTKTRLACFFGEGVGSVCGIQGEAMDPTLEFTYDVKFNKTK